MALNTVFLHSLQTLLKNKATSLEFSVVSALKSISSSPSLVSQAQQLHCLVLTLGLDFNAVVQNSLISLYSKTGIFSGARSIFGSPKKLDYSSFGVMFAGYLKRGRLGDALNLFETMPLRNCVSYTQIECFRDAIRLFRELRQVGEVTDEETMASVLSSYALAGGQEMNAKMLHGLVTKLGLDMSGIVSTNLVHLYSISSSLDDARVMFDNMVDRDVMSWNAILNGYVKEGLVDLGRVIFEAIPEKDVVSWGTMIDGYLQVGRWKEALGLYCEMRETGLMPDEVMVVDIVYACGKARRYVEGHQFHALTVKTGMNCYNFMQAALIHFYVKYKRLELAFMQFEDGLEETEVSYSTKLQARFDNGRCNDGLKLFREIQARHRSPDLVTFFFERNDAMTYNVLMRGLCRAGRTAEAISFLREMEGEGVLPNIETYNILIEGLCSEKKFNESKDLLNELWSKGLMPEAATFNIVIAGLCGEGHIEQAKELMGQMESVGIMPNKVSYNVLTRGFVGKNADVTDAIPLLEEMEQKGFILDISTFQMFLQRLPPMPEEPEISRDVVSFNIMLQGLFHECKYDEGLKHFREMKGQNLSPNLMTYNILLRGLCRAYRVDEAYSFLQQMADTGISPSIVTYNTLIEGLCKDNKLERAKDLLNEIESKGLKPNAVTLNILVAALCQQGQIHEAKDLMERMSDKGCSPNNVTYNGIVRYLVKVNGMDAAVPFLKEMERKEFMLDAATIELLVEHLPAERNDNELFPEFKQLAPASS